MDRKSESKSNLNESTLPLLDEDVNKEKIELQDQVDKSAESTEAAAESKADDAAAEAKKKKEEEKERKRQQKLEEEEKKKQAKLEKQKKKEEEKELKKQKEAEKKAAKEAAKANGSANVSGGNGVAGGKSWNAYNQFTVGINLLDRDERTINEHVNVNFEDIIGEPDAAQGFDGAYRLSFGVFQFIRFWVYRILMTILSVPFALFWALTFAFLSLVSVWVLTPAFRVLDIVFYFVHRIWNALVRTFLDPVFSSISLVRSQSKPLNVTPTPTYSGKSVFRSGAKYNQLSTSETVASYTKTGDDDQVALNIESQN